MQISEYVRPQKILDLSKGKSLFVGGGVYPTVALFNHSCNPGVVRYDTWFQLKLDKVKFVNSTHNIIIVQILYRQHNDRSSNKINPSWGWNFRKLWSNIHWSWRKWEKANFTSPILVRLQLWSLQRSLASFERHRS